MRNVKTLSGLKAEGKAFAKNLAICPPVASNTLPSFPVSLPLRKKKNQLGNRLHSDDLGISPCLDGFYPRAPPGSDIAHFPNSASPRYLPQDLMSFAEVVLSNQSTGHIWLLARIYPLLLQELVTWTGNAPPASIFPSPVPSLDFFLLLRQ